MAIGAETYRTAAIEHSRAFQELWRQERYVLAHYVAGLAVECIFRAHHALRSDEFDARHDLHALARSARFFDLIPANDERQQRQIGFALSVVVQQWQNDHRYRSEASLRQFLKDRKLDRGVKGDFVKESSKTLIEAALQIINSMWGLRDGRNTESCNGQTSASAPQALSKGQP